MANIKITDLTTEADQVANQWIEIANSGLNTSRKFDFTTVAVKDETQTISATYTFGDSNKIIFGAGSDGEMYSDGTDVVFDTNGKELNVISDATPLFDFDAVKNTCHVPLLIPDDNTIDLGTNQALTMGYDSAQTRVEFILSSAEGDLAFMDTNENPVFIIQAAAGLKVAFAATSEVHFDGDTGGDTYITESAANVFEINCGGTEAVKISAGSETVLKSNSILLQRAAGTATYLTCTVTTSVDIYYNNVKKLETTNTGITVTGICNASGGFADNGTPGIDTTFDDNDLNTITVSGGLITAKTAP